MFPMNDTVRKSLDSNVALTREISGQVLDWQATVALTTQKQFNAFFDGYRTLLDANDKTVRAMQQSVAARMAPVETAA